MWHFAGSPIRAEGSVRHGPATPHGAPLSRRAVARALVCAVLLTGAAALPPEEETKAAGEQVAAEQEANAQKALTDSPTDAQARAELQSRLHAHGWPDAIDLALRETAHELRLKRRWSTAPWYLKNRTAWLQAIMLSNDDLTRAIDVDLSDRDVGGGFAEVLLAYAPTAQANSWEAAYFHQLQLRSIQQVLAHNSINLAPMQGMSYFWAVRALMARRRLARLPPPTLCEIGFGSGMSAAVLLTATSDERSTLNGAGRVHILDCNGCAGGGTGKHLFGSYLRASFPRRLTFHEGKSEVTLPRFAAAHPHVRCDIFSIDGGHKFEEVATDLANARKLSHAQTLLLLDDTSPGSPPFRATAEAQAAGTLEIQETLHAERRPDPIMATYRGYRVDKDGRKVRRMGDDVKKHWQIARFKYP